MSRAMNVTLAEEKVAAMCLKSGISISAIEVLPSGGTHVVLNTPADADVIRGLMTKYLIEGPVKRFPFYRVT